MNWAKTTQLGAIARYYFESLKTFAKRGRGGSSHTREAKQDCLRGEKDGRQEVGPRVRCFQIDFLPTTARKHTAKFHPHAETRERKCRSKHPQHERCAYATDTASNRGGRREDSIADDFPNITDFVSLSKAAEMYVLERTLRMLLRAPLNDGPSYLRYSPPG